MEHEINIGVSCGVSQCRFNQDGMHCELDRIHVGNCEDGHCTCCDSFQKRR